MLNCSKPWSSTTVSMVHFETYLPEVTDTILDHKLTILKDIDAYTIGSSADKFLFLAPMYKLKTRNFVKCLQFLSLPLSFTVFYYIAFKGAIMLHVLCRNSTCVLFSVVDPQQCIPCSSLFLCRHTFTTMVC